MRIIISPSGNLYGSENVLFDYLTKSELTFDEILVPHNSPFQKKLKNTGINSKGFRDLKWLYVYVFFKLLFHPKSHAYCNEGGHSKYVILLSKLLPWIKFTIHIRMIEDASIFRFNGLNVNNTRIISISNSVCKRILLPNLIINDGYDFSNQMKFKSLPTEGKFKIGIIGRITHSKGMDLLADILDKLILNNIEIQLYGGIDPKIQEFDYFKKIVEDERVSFMGVYEKKEKIYSNIDLVLHLNDSEALGRVFFECLDFGKYFIGLKYEGINEIANQIGYPYVYFRSEIQQVIQNILEGRFEVDERILYSSRNKAITFYSVEKYTILLDQILK